MEMTFPSGRVYSAGGCWMAAACLLGEAETLCSLTEHTASKSSRASSCSGRCGEMRGDAGVRGVRGGAGGWGGCPCQGGRVGVDGAYLAPQLLELLGVGGRQRGSALGRPRRGACL
eukprot:scaffold41220_cov71-Phaeocystis_antarctica.AAC.24